MDDLSVLTKLSLVFLIVLFLINSDASAQDKSGIDNQNDISILESTGQIYGSDDLLVNGRIYYQKYPLAEGHPYFDTEEWMNGLIFINGRSFPGYEIKYDLEMDEIVLNTRDKKGAFVDIILNHQVIDSLYIGNRFFINTTQFVIDKPVSNFFEVVFNGVPMLLVYHKKEFLKEYNERYPHGRYRDPIQRIFLYTENDLVDVSKKKAFLNYYEPYKKEIKKFMKRNRIIYKKADKQELFRLMEFCSIKCN